MPKPSKSPVNPSFLDTARAFYAEAFDHKRKRDLADAGALMAGPVTRRPSEAGAAIEVYPLALPEGEGASIPLGQWGEVGFANHEGLLVLTVPWAMAGWLRQRLGDAIVHGPAAGLSMDCSARVAEAWVRLRPGMRASVPLGALEECGVEAG